MTHPVEQPRPSEIETLSHLPYVLSSTPYVEIVRPAQNTNALTLAVHACIAKGWRVDAMGANSAVMVSGHPVNHTLHAILTMCTCLVWGLMWLILAATTHEMRMTITIDSYGQPVYSKPVKSR